MIRRWFAKRIIQSVAGISPAGRARLASWIGGFAYRLGIRRAITLDNLRHAFPQLAEANREEVARGAYRNMAHAFIDGLAASALSDADIAGQVIVENPELLDTTLAQGKGLLIATAHFGSWELLGDVMAKRGLKLHAVVRPLKGALNEQLVENRRKNGLGLISPRGALRQSVALVEQGKVVVMLIDQVLPASQGVFVPFFGREASTNPALSWVALRTGAPVLVAMGAREGDTLRLFFEGPFPVPPGDRDTAIAEHTATLTSVLERYIRKYPDQWLWLHRRWKVKAPSSEDRTQTADAA